MFSRHWNPQHFLKIISSIAPLIAGFAILTLWFLNFPLFLNLIVDFAVFYYIFQAFHQLKEFQKLHNLKLAPWITVIMVIVAVAAAISLIYFQLNNIFIFLLLAGGFSGIYFALRLLSSFMSIHQLLKDHPFQTKTLVSLALIVTLTTSAILITLSLTSSLAFAIFVSAIIILYGIARLVLNILLHHFGKNELTLKLQYLEKNKSEH
ncbi:MAG: hypothetical protein K2L37_04470 [Lactobacillus sp.]|nr:hypothetical protein [Lactobacillus sp.]